MKCEGAIRLVLIGLGDEIRLKQLEMREAIAFINQGPMSSFRRP